MRKKFLPLLIIITVFSSCYSVKVVSPSTKNEVQLASETEQLSFKVKKPNWYILWGLVPLNKTNTDEIIQTNGLNRVRVEVKHTFLDNIISAILGTVSVVKTTSIVEGNTSK